MRAVVYDRYGSPDELKLEEVPRPSPKNDEVLIRIHAATVTAGDCEVRRFDIQPLFWLPVRLAMGVFKPRHQILGQEWAGEVVEIGKAVTRFKVGDALFGPTNMNMGAYAEYICLPEKHAMARKPEGLSFGEAVTIPVGGLNALYFLRKADIQPGEKVLVNGAGGSIGTYGIQIAKSLGAVVTGVDSGEKLEMLRSIGADEVWDFTEADITKSGKTFNVIFDVAGKSSFSGLVRSLNTDGRLLLSNPRFFEMIRGAWISATGTKRIYTGMADESSEDLAAIASMIVDGKLRPVVEKQLSLADVPEAHRYVEAGHKKGNVVIHVGSGDRE